MNLGETTELCRMIAAICPAQRFDSLTPKAWFVVLQNLQFADAVLALERLGVTLRFIAVADVVGEVKRIRADRIARSGLADYPFQSIADLRRVTALAGDGVWTAAEHMPAIEASSAEQHTDTAAKLARMIGGAR